MVHPNTPLLFDLKIIYSYVIEVADFETELGFYNRGLIVDLFAFLLIRMTITIENYSTCHFYLRGYCTSIFKIIFHILMLARFARSHKHLKNPWAEQNYR